MEDSPKQTQVAPVVLMRQTLRPPSPLVIPFLPLGTAFPAPENLTGAAAGRGLSAPLGYSPFCQRPPGRQEEAQGRTGTAAAGRGDDSQTSDEARTITPKVWRGAHTG